MYSSIKYIVCLSIVLLYASCKPPYIYVHQGELNTFDSTYNQTDHNIADLISPYKLGIDSLMNQPVGYCGSEMTKSRPESALGNAVVDLLINYVNTEKSIQPDLCVMNFGGLRTSLNPGIITRGKVYELMPFDNSLVLVELNSDEMDQLATHIVNRGGEPIGGTNKVSLSNLGGYSQFTIDQAINSKESYQILTSDYLANGGDGFSMFAAAGDKINLNVLIRDALIHQFQTSTSEQQPLTGHVEGRIQLSGHE